MPPRIDPGACDECEDCLFACLNNAIAYAGAALVIDPERCVACNACVRACRKGAIRRGEGAARSPAVVFPPADIQSAEHRHRTG